MSIAEELIEQVLNGNTVSDVVESVTEETKYINISDESDLLKQVLAAWKKAGIKHTKPVKSPIPKSKSVTVSADDWEKALDIQHPIERAYWKELRKKQGKGEFRK